jgi:hypothetical protein
MPLDPSIFMNSAALYAQGQQNLQNNIANSIQGYSKRVQDNQLLDIERQKLEQEKALKQAALQSPVEQAKRLEGIGQLSLFKRMQKQPMSPEENTAADMYILSQEKTYLDPINGPVTKNPYGSFFSRLAPSSVNSAPVVPAQTNNIVDALNPDMAVINRMTADEAAGYLPPGVAESAMIPRGEGSSSIQGIMLPSNASRKTTQVAQEADINAQSKKLEEYNKEKGQTQAKNEAKVPNIDLIEASVDKMLSKAGDLPGGMINRGIAAGTDALNRPNKASIAQASLAPEFAFTLSKMKELVKTPGEGSFTDADQKLINELVFDKGDSNESIKQKLTSLKEILGRYRGTLKGGAQRTGIQGGGATYRWNADAGKLEAIE